MIGDREDFFQNYGGVINNDLNKLLNSVDDDNDGELNNYPKSSYIDTDELITYLNMNKKNVTMLSLNCQSINAKFSQIELMVNFLKSKELFIDVICLQECWLDKTCDTSLFELDDYNMISQSKKCCGHGGLITFVKKQYSYKKKSLYNSSDLWEGLFVDISRPELNKNILIGNIYRPPKFNNNNNTIRSFTNEFTILLNKLQKESSDAILAGDFNIDLLELNKRELYGEFFDLMTSNSFFPHFTLPTRFARKSASLIDQIYVRNNHIDKSINSYILCNNISDHMACITEIGYLNNKYKSLPKFVTVRKKDDASIIKFRDALINSDMLSKCDTSSSGDPNKNYEIIHDTIQNAMNEHLPTKTMKFNLYKHKISKWITTGLLKSLQFRDKLYKKLRKSKPGTLSYTNNEINLRSYSLILKKCIHSAKRNYYYAQLEKYKKDTRKTWETIKDILNKSKSKQRSVSFTLNNRSITNHNEIAIGFNEQFSNIIGVSSDSDNTSYKRYLRQRPDLIFSFKPVENDDIIKIIQQLTTKDSTGYDNLSTKILKYVGDVLSTSLCLLVNQSFVKGIFPTKLKIAKVKPLFKKDDNSLFENYRPISLLPAISKVFEKAAYYQIYEYFKSNELFHRSQYGFRSLHSTELAATELVDRVLEYFDKGDIVLSLFLDLSKAFDMINHKILLEKLAFYGFDFLSNKWVNSYLSDRYQYVEYEECSSPKSLICRGVPQGSVLGPLLFLIFINDICNCSSIFEFILFADDTSLIAPMCSFVTSDITCDVNCELEKVSNWLSANELVLNVKKTKFMLFHSFGKNLNRVTIPQIKINDTLIERVNTFDFLGFVIDETLSWNYHINKIATKIGRVIGVMSKLKRLVPSHTLKLMYNSLILPHINYGITLWGHKSSRLVKLQKKAIRVLSKSKYNAHTEPILKKESLLSIDDIYHLNCLKFYHKYVNSKLPSYFKDYYERRSHHYNTRSTLPDIQYSRTNYSRNRLRNYIPVLLRNTTDSIISKVNTHSLKGFSEYIKRVYIEKYQSFCTNRNCYVCNHLS